jgi:serine/threonine protein kinase
LYSLVIGKLPFDDKDNEVVRRKIVKGDYKFPKDIHLSESCRDMIVKMLAYDPKKRINMKSIFNHKWVEPFTRKLCPLIRYGTLMNLSFDSQHDLDSQP